MGTSWGFRSKVRGFLFVNCDIAFEQTLSIIYDYIRKYYHFLLPRYINMTLCKRIRIAFKTVFICACVCQKKKKCVRLFDFFHIIYDQKFFSNAQICTAQFIWTIQTVHLVYHRREWSTEAFISPSQYWLATQLTRKHK